MHPFLSTGGWGAEPPTKFSKRGGLTGKEGDNFFQGGLQFLQKKLKSEIFNHKKVYNQKYFSLS